MAAGNHPTQSDELSVSSAAVDWQQALAEHRRWLRTVVLARLGDADAADEVLQQVAVTALAKGGSLRDPAKVAPWLYRVAVTEALQYRRRCGTQRQVTARFAQREMPTEHDAREPDPLDWLLADETRKLVRDALSRLPRRDAEILLLKYTEDWSYRQLAQRMGISESAVEARLHRARGRMRKAMAAVDPTLRVVSAGSSRS